MGQNRNRKLAENEQKMATVNDPNDDDVQLGDDNAAP
jgi:hypothetical protein